MNKQQRLKQKAIAACLSSCCFKQWNRRAGSPEPGPQNPAVRSLVSARACARSWSAAQCSAVAPHLSWELMPGSSSPFCFRICFCLGRPTDQPFFGIKSTGDTEVEQTKQVRGGRKKKQGSQNFGLAFFSLQSIRGVGLPFFSLPLIGGSDWWFGLVVPIGGLVVGGGVLALYGALHATTPNQFGLISLFGGYPEMDGLRLSLSTHQKKGTLQNVYSVSRNGSAMFEARYSI